MKLKLFKEADQELKQFDNFEKSEFFYEFQARFYPERKGCMIPFGFRMLHAEISQFLSRPDETTASLYKLLNVINETINDLLPKKNESKHEPKYFNSCFQSMNLFFAFEGALKIWYERKVKVLFSIVNILISRKVHILEKKFSPFTFLEF